MLREGQMRLLRVCCRLTNSSIATRLHRVIFALLYLEESLQFLNAPARLFQCLIQLIIDEYVILIRILEVLDLLLKVFNVNPTPLDLLIQVLHRLLKLFEIICIRFSRAL